MKKWKPHCWRKRATSRVHQHTVNNINLCYTREQAVNTKIPSPLFHWRRQHMANVKTQQVSWALVERYHTGKSLLYLLYLCNKFSEESVSLSSAVDFVPQYKDFYCNISYGPSPSLAHPVPEVPKFTAVSFTLTSQKPNLQSMTTVFHFSAGFLAPYV